MEPPLIVTLEADRASQDRFEAARRRWFPADRNLVPAHVTLFHQMPGVSETEAIQRLGVAAAGAPLPFRVVAPMRLGGGVAYRLDLPGGTALRDRIGAGMDRTAQDRGGLRSHVTVQNKVSREVAAATYQGLAAGFAPWNGRMEALRLWRYLGGPWEAVGTFPFCDI
ncbi:MAG: 2'-5' RNA ligase family protein [Pseudomonadota bacterium]